MCSYFFCSDWYIDIMADLVLLVIVRAGLQAEMSLSIVDQ